MAHTGKELVLAAIQFLSPRSLFPGFFILYIKDISLKLFEGINYKPRKHNAHKRVYN